MALSEFISTIQGQDLARQNRYSVSVHGPGGLANRNLSLLCESAQFPGQNIRTTADSLRAGPTREMGQGVTYGPITLRFICTPSMSEKKFFEDWQDLMIDKSTWQVAYYKDYIGEIEMQSLDYSERDRYSITIHEAYPKIITAQDYSYQSNNAYQTISVEFTYWFWESDNSSPAQLANRQGARRGIPVKKAATGDAATQVDTFSELNGSNPGSRTTTATGSQHSGFKHHNYMNDKGE